MELKSTTYAESQNDLDFDKLMKNIGFYQR
jgi:hypothetical protein